MGVIFMPNNLIWQMQQCAHILILIMHFHTGNSKLTPPQRQHHVVMLLQVSVRELHNSLVSDPNDGGLKDARYEDGKIIISDSTLRSLFPPQ